MKHKPHAIHISNREMKLEEEQVNLIKDYQRHLMFGDEKLADETLTKAHEVNAEYDRERQCNADIAKKLLIDPAIKDVFIQNNLS